MTLRPALLATLALAALASGCATPATGPQADPNLAATPLDAWQTQVKVVAAPEVIRLAPHRTGLSANQAQALAGFADAWRQSQSREILLRAPVGGPNADGASRVAWEAQERLVGLGVPPGAIRMSTYDAGGDPGAPVMIGFDRFVADVPACGNWRNLSHSNDNRVHDNFGCAVTANMAVQIANPEDMLEPRGLTPPDAQQRGVMFEKYRKGEATGSAWDDMSKGSVSQVVN